MRVSLSGLKLDNPALPLLRAQVTYQGTTDIIGNAFGTTIQDTLCSTVGLQPSYAGQILKLLSSDAAGQIRTIAIHALATGILSIAAPFTDFNDAVYQVPAGTQFVILSSSGGGGAPPPAPPAPSVGLWMFGHVDPAMAAGSLNTFACPNLAGFEDDLFNDEFWIQIIHNDNAAGTPPEREIRRVLDYVGGTGTFTTDPFSAVVEADDLLCLFHESIMGIEILGFGTLDTSSITLPADSTRPGLYAWENNEYFRGCLLMPTEGDCRFQPRPIAHYINATGVFDLALEPFSQLPGLVDYVLIRFAYPVDVHEKINLILAIVNAILKLTETGGTLTADGTEQTIYINETPMGVYEPRKVKIDCSNMAWGDVVILRWYERLNATGDLVLKDEWRLEDVQDADLGKPPIKNIELEPNRFGVHVTLQQTAGAKVFPWEMFMEV